MFFFFSLSKWVCERVHMHFVLTLPHGSSEKVSHAHWITDEKVHRSEHSIKIENAYSCVIQAKGKNGNTHTHSHSTGQRNTGWSPFCAISFFVRRFEYLHGLVCVLLFHFFFRVNVVVVSISWTKRP